MKKNHIADIVISIVMYILSAVSAYISAKKGYMLTTVSYILVAGIWQMNIILRVVKDAIDKLKEELQKNNSK